MFKKLLIRKLKLINAPHLKVYKGFGNLDHCTILGHALLRSAPTREKFKNGVFSNTLSLLKTFMIKTMPDAPIEVEWQGKVYKTRSQHDGFFTLTLPNEPKLERGVYEAKITLKTAARETLSAATGNIHIPSVNQYTFISDIDDTFLISHSASIFKRLKLLLTRNAHSRQPFEGVVKHYNALQAAHTNEDNPNPFFYVSSSEWNLYDFITTFIKKNQLPDGVCLLNQIQTLSKVLKSGQKNHASKFARIVRILEAYPTQRFVLLGDDSQHDPYIYESLAKNFPQLIHCVYIRCVGREKKKEVMEALDQISGREIPVCYFEHSIDALQHSFEIGLIDKKK
ncbi:App1 family protein [Niabella insulamsoli]|uniref:App1 family protein n=1 Tax=Niabella insulamsoli TaxID=3144874 RepID=UPI0031FCAACE